MNAIKYNNDKIIIEITRKELGVLGNTLKVVCDSIEEWEFETRMGVSINEAKALLESLNSIYQSPWHFD